MRWNRKRSIFKNHRNCLPLRLGVRSRQKPVRRLHNPPLKLNEYLLNVLLNTYWMLLSSVELALWAKNDLLWFNRIFRLFYTRKSCVFQIFLLRSIKAYLYPNIINFESVDFSERRPKEVISFFWRSVYNYGDVTLLIWFNKFIVCPQDLSFQV